MKSASMSGEMARSKKVLLHRAKASDILDSLQIGPGEERRAKAALATVQRLHAARASRKAAAKRASGAKRRNDRGSRAAAARAK